MMTDDISVFLSKLLCYNRVLVATHVSPDADAIGSLLAAGAFLKSKGKQVSLYAEGGCPESCGFLSGSDTISGALDPAALESELFLMLDCAEIKRTGIDPGLLSGIKNVAVLDHHIAPSAPKCSFGYVDPGASSTAILIYKLIRAANSQPDLGMSNAILAGIAGDTGAFRFSNTTAEVMQVSGDLMDRGADLPRIIKEYFMSRSKQVTFLLGKVLSGIKYYYDDRLALAVISNEDFCGIDKSELEGINAELNSIKGLRLSVLLREEIKGSWRCSFRSDGFVDCSRLASAFDGGGHKNAAGCTIKADSSGLASEMILKEVAAWKGSFA